MFRKSFQKGFLTVLFSGGASPLRIWDRMVKFAQLFFPKIFYSFPSLFLWFLFFYFQIVNGHVKRVTDEDVRTLVLEMRGTNVATCYIFTPINPKEVLGITLPFLVMIIKNLKKYFSFEIQVRYYIFIILYFFQI